MANHMRDDVRELLEKTFEEIKCGARTLDPATEIDIVLAEHGYQIVKITRRERAPMVLCDEES